MFLIQNEIIWYICIVPVVIVVIGLSLASPNNLGYNKNLANQVATYIQYSICAIAIDWLVKYEYNVCYHTLPIIQLIFMAFVVYSMVKTYYRKKELKDE